MTNLEWIDVTGYRASQIRLINNGSGCAYLHASGELLNSLVVKPYISEAPVRLPWRGEIKSFAIKEQQLFVIGALTNEPLGIWKYNLISSDLKQLASNQERIFQYAVSQPALVNHTKERNLTYYLLKPSYTIQKRLPPLVLGIMGVGEKAYVWDRYAETIANCGACFVIVDRRGRSELEWADDARIVYDTLAGKVAFDTNNVYLLGISAGAAPINQLLESRPEQWRGAIYYSPGSLPAPSLMRSKRMLVDIGGLDPIWGTNSIRAKVYLKTAAKTGADMRLFIRQGVGHNCRLLSVEKERLHQLAAFLDESN